MKRLMTPIRSTFDSAAMRARNGAGRILRERLYGNAGRMESRPQARLSGSALDGGTLTLKEATSNLRIHGSIARPHKLDANSYTVRVLVKKPGDADFSFVGGGTHAALGDFPAGHKNEGKERPVRLGIEFTTPLPAGTQVKVEFDSPNEMLIGIDTEAG